jgi:hypothetical protein
LSIDEANSFWTPQTKNAFAIKVAQAGSTRFISPAAVKVSNQMLAVVHGSGASFLSTQTFARDTDLSIDTVKKSRRQLRQRGFWTAHLSQGGRGQIACYRPDPAVLDRKFDEAREPFDLEMVDVKGTQIPSEEGVDWEDILLCNNESENQIEREASVDPRRSDAARLGDSMEFRALVKYEPDLDRWRVCVYLERETEFAPRRLRRKKKRCPSSEFLGQGAA